MRSSEAVTKLKMQGLFMPAKPEIEIPDLPTDITELDDDGLMELFVILTGWNDHLAAQVAVSMVDEREAQRDVDVAEAQAMVRHWKGGTGDRVAIVKAQIAADPIVLDLYEKLEELYAYRKLVEVLSNNIERDAALVSRELTRRTSGDTYKGRGRRFTT
jgi:hypothetical protein